MGMQNMKSQYSILRDTCAIGLYLVWKVWLRLYLKTINHIFSLSFHLQAGFIIIALLIIIIIIVIIVIIPVTSRNAQPVVFTSFEYEARPTLRFW